MTNTAAFLHSTEAAPIRRARLDGYAKLDMTVPTMVVHVETDRGMVELDADDKNHAQRMIDAWIGKMGHKSARFYTVTPDGALILPSAIYDFRDYSEVA